MWSACAHVQITSPAPKTSTKISWTCEISHNINNLVSGQNSKARNGYLLTFANESQKAASYKAYLLDVGETRFFPSTYHIDGASVPLISKKSYPSSSWKSVKTKAMVSPGSARMVQVQSALFPYSEGKWGLEMVLLVPRRVPPQAPSAGKSRNKRQSGFQTASNTSATTENPSWPVTDSFWTQNWYSHYDKGFFWFINLVLRKNLQKSKQLHCIISWIFTIEEREIVAFLTSGLRIAIDLTFTDSLTKFSKIFSESYKMEVIQKHLEI